MKYKNRGKKLQHHQSSLERPKTETTMERIMKFGADPVLASIQALNKSWTQKIIVGLEYSDSSATSFGPIVWFCGNNCNGIKVTVKEWRFLKRKHF